MNFCLKLSVLLIFISQSSLAETATERASMYFGDIANKKFELAATHFDPMQLKEFRDMMEFYKDLPSEQKTQFVQTFFGSDKTPESLQKLSDVEFFSGVFNFIMKQADAAGGINFDGLEILGEVPEGDNVTHLVTRNRISVGKIEIEAMEVVSLKKHGTEWRIQLSGKIKGLPDQLKAAFAKE